MDTWTRQIEMCRCTHSNLLAHTSQPDPNQVAKTLTAGAQLQRTGSTRVSKNRAENRTAYELLKHYTDPTGCMNGEQWNALVGDLLEAHHGAELPIAEVKMMAAALGV